MKFTAIVAAAAAGCVTASPSEPNLRSLLFAQVPKPDDGSSTDPPEVPNCSDSDTWFTMEIYPSTCAEWAEKASCTDGLTMDQASEVQHECPVACGTLSASCPQPNEGPNCSDSDTFYQWGDSCTQWADKGYSCTDSGLTEDQATEMQQECPVSCGTLPASCPQPNCSDSDTFELWGNSCTQWTASCTVDSGLTEDQVTEMQQECPVSCGTLPASCPN